MDQSLVNLVLALATTELLHNIFEVSNVRRKVQRLNAYIKKQEYKEMPMNIDTRPKAYGLSAISLVVLVGVFYGVFSIVNLSGNAALWYAVVVLVLAFVALSVLLDKYHVEIERVTRPFMNKK
jgi:hypothetical protein